jgi:small subunit ribosomal protein S4
LYLKGDRCYSDKCAFERRAFGPGQHGQAKFKKLSDYALQLREKQKVKSMYGMLEDQFRLTFEKAERQKGVTGENLLVLLERRLDNAIYRLGMASSRNQARQLVRHKHVLVNGRKVNIPSFLVAAGDEISLKDKSKANSQILENIEAVARRGVPSWMELDKDAVKATVKALPNREELTLPIQEHLIVELYSK